MVRHTGIVEDLRLAECGLHLPRPGPVGLRTVRDPTTGEQQALTFHVYLDATCDSIAALCGDRDAEAYRAFVTDWAGRNEAVFAAFQDVPTAGRLGRHLWGAGKATSVGGLEMSRQFLQPADQLLDEHFADERLKTALAWLGAQSGPPTHEVATADLVGWNALMHRMPPGRAVGGCGALTVALAERLRRLGGTVRLGDGAAAITRSGDRVTGVTTESGEHARGPRRRGRLPRADHPRAARRRGAARPGDHRGAGRQRHRHGGAARHHRTAALPAAAGSSPYSRDAAARAEPHPPAGGVRRVHRGPHADRAGRAGDVVSNTEPNQ